MPSGYYKAGDRAVRRGVRLKCSFCGAQGVNITTCPKTTREEHESRDSGPHFSEQGIIQSEPTPERLEEALREYAESERQPISHARRIELEIYTRADSTAELLADIEAVVEQFPAFIGLLHLEGL